MSYSPSQPKRVMHLIWSLDLGGAEQVVLNIVSRLDRKFFEPIVCCLNEKGRYAHQVEKEGIRVTALHKSPKFDPFLIPRLVHFIKKERVDLIHTHLFTGNLWGRIAAKITGVPVISTEHGMDTWRKRFHLTLDAWLTRVNQRVVFVSEGVKRFYSERNSSLNGKGRVVHNGIDVNLFEKRTRQVAILKNFGVRETSKVIGIVGRLAPEKSHVDFIEAIQWLREKGKDVVGLIVGEGPLEGDLKKLAREVGLEDRIVFVGFREDLSGLYSCMDAFVICSLREGLPLTILEAMASGVPVVATKVGGIPESISDGEDGLLVPAGDTLALAESIKKILEDEGLRGKLIRNAKQKVRSYFSVEKMVKHHEELYMEVLAL